MPATTTLFTTEGELNLVMVIMFFFAVVAGGGLLVIIASFFPQQESATERRTTATLVTGLCGPIALALFVVLSLFDK